jgi:glycosyltransferase involved in cell wall biosynthesis
MDVSVVIPTRDRPDLLALTLRTVLWQECVETEILVIDDGDEPATAEVVDRVETIECGSFETAVRAE